MRRLHILITLVVLALLVSACGPSLPIDADPNTAAGDRFLLSVPRLVIDFDDQGEASIGELAASDLEPLLGGPLPVLDPKLVAQLAGAGIQHIEVAHTDDGLFLYVNGQLLPHMGWDEAALESAGRAGAMFQVPFLRLLEVLAPIIERTGLNVVLRLPSDSGGEEIPLREGGILPEAAVPDAEEAKAIVVMDVEFDSDGVPRLAGVTTRELGQAANLDLRALELPAETLAALKDSGVEELRLRVGDEGIFIAVNDMVLPHLAWNNAALDSSLDLYDALSPASPLTKVLQLLVPELNNTNVDLVVRFT
jgi:hypothetical protein